MILFATCSNPNKSKAGIVLPKYKQGNWDTKCFSTFLQWAIDNGVKTHALNSKSSTLSNSLHLTLSALFPKFNGHNSY